MHSRAGYWLTGKYINCVGKLSTLKMVLPGLNNVRFVEVKVKGKKVKFSLQEAMKAQRVLKV